MLLAVLWMLWTLWSSSLLVSRLHAFFLVVAVRSFLHTLVADLSDTRTVGWSQRCRVELTWVWFSQIYQRTLVSRQNWRDRAPRKLSCDGGREHAWNAEQNAIIDCHLIALGMWMMTWDFGGLCVVSFLLINDALTTQVLSQFHANWVWSMPRKELDGHHPSKMIKENGWTDMHVQTTHTHTRTHTMRAAGMIIVIHSYYRSYLHLNKVNYVLFVIQRRQTNMQIVCISCQYYVSLNGLGHSHRIQSNLLLPFCWYLRSDYLPFSFLSPFFLQTLFLYVYKISFSFFFCCLFSRLVYLVSLCVCVTVCASFSGCFLFAFLHKF